ncbi:hypothetical protein Pla110_06840 [Polystyrenella longa]|uniref:Uncharacterized protein n=1 Tax=Polystyrenella longa TaxID=2528007 RepID=A0A518CIE6_9PLAN|nr:hypothetical protein [Polystyrenella longa]QDU78980.1 hypothetical protein Pla110_06840 [Polystyrenella longa]
MKFEVHRTQIFKSIEQYRRKQIPEQRRELAEDVARETLRETVEFNPVETGRTRAAWLVSLLRLGGESPVGWSSGRGDSFALQEGRAAGSLQEVESKNRSELRVRNGVEYINYLEYGTRNRTPAAMVRRALQRVVQKLRRRS